MYIQGSTPHTGEQGFYNVYLGIHPTPWGVGILQYIFRDPPQTLESRNSIMYIYGSSPHPGEQGFYHVYLEIHPKLWRVGILQCIFRDPPYTLESRDSTMYIQGSTPYPGVQGFYNVYLGIHPTPWRVGILPCIFRDPPHTLESRDSTMYIRYYTTSNSPNNGFKANIKIGKFFYFSSFEILNSVRSINISLKYQQFIPSRYRDYRNFCKDSIPLSRFSEE